MKTANDRDSGGTPESTRETRVLPQTREDLDYGDDAFGRPGILLPEWARRNLTKRACVETGRRRGTKLRERQGLTQDEPGTAGAGPRVRIGLRPFQLPVFRDRSTGILVLHWSRQIGKSFALAAWAVDRLLTRPGRLVTVLSNSRDNGAEFVAKCAEVCRLNGTEYKSVDRSKGSRFQNMRMEVRIRAEGKIGRIKVLAANPRTARGFSGDLILDEFAFHEDSQAIWEAAEPILASNPDFLCRIASTGNGRHNLFYRMTANVGEVVMWKKEEEFQDSSVKIQGPASAQKLPPTPGYGGTSRRAKEMRSEEQETKGIYKEARKLGREEEDGGSAECGIRNAELGIADLGTDSEEIRSKIRIKIKKEGEDGESAERGKIADCGLGIADLGTDSEEIRSKIRRDEEGIKSRIRSKIRRETECRGVLIGTGVVMSPAGFAVSRITRTMAHEMGVKIYDANTRAAVSPEAARAQALDKRAYDQNYECAFADENATLLSHELISAAEREGVGFICEQDWSAEFLRCARDGNFEDAQSASLPGAGGNLYVGFDVGRKVDLSVLTVMEDVGGLRVVRGILRMQNMRLPEQQVRLGEICRLARFRRAAIDMTGLGLGLFEYAQEEFGAGRIAGVNFAGTVPVRHGGRAAAVEGRKRETVRVTEAMAMELLQAYEDRRIWHPADGRLRDDLRKPEKITTPGGRVSIAATRDEAGHADHFWSFALALEAAGSGGGEFYYQAIARPERGVLV